MERLKERDRDRESVLLRKFARLQFEMVSLREAQQYIKRIFLFSTKRLEQMKAEKNELTKENCNAKH